MPTHRISVEAAFREDSGVFYGQGKFFWAYKGMRIGESRQPLLDAARWLLAHDKADPSDRIEMWRGETRSLSSTVGAAARLTVAERKNGLYFEFWKPFSTSAVGPHIDEPNSAGTHVTHHNLNAPCHDIVE